MNRAHVFAVTLCPSRKGIRLGEKGGNSDRTSTSGISKDEPWAAPFSVRDGPESRMDSVPPKRD